MTAATTETETLRSFILSFLKSSSTDELNAVFREIASVILVDGSKRGGPKISAVNGVWIEKSYERQYIGVYNGFKVLRLPYRQGDNDTSRQFSMYIYLPDENDGLDNLVEKMTSTDGFLDNHIPSWTVEVGDFRIPKFKIEFGFKASSVFDFDLGVSLYQKALVEIDEKGTEAAAATYMVGNKVSLCSRRHTPLRIDFVADHPFFFMIREDKTGTVLFAGQIFDPS
ncbi:serpin-Z2 isoform X3 [Capsella rubella]|uniref:serpin-Z2 isoform X3 n=1 Tax=Capsella rubella TaxID=81985 RepID=UPI000CD5B239|nr:serpin-Z2 isoform X3 [Capsella rubella]